MLWEMLVLRVGDAYPIAGAGACRAGTIGLWFTVAGTVVAVTEGDNTITIGGVAGTFFECPLASITSITSATVLGIIGR
jgi:hypothetical protein